MSVEAMRGWNARLIINIIIVLNIATDHKRSAHYGASPTHVLCITRFHALVSNEEGRRLSGDSHRNTTQSKSNRH